MRSPILSFLVLLAAAPAVAGRAGPYTESSQQVLEARGLRRLIVDNARGGIQLRESSDGRVHVRAYKICRGRDVAEAKDYASQTQVHSVREGSQHSIRVTYPRRTRTQVSWWELFQGGDFSDVSRPRAEVRLQIEAPRALAFELLTASGDIDARGSFASLEARAASGDIVFAGLDARLRTSSGDVTLLSARRVVVTTSSGDCTADSVSASFSFESSSGDLTLGAASDSVHVRTSSGDIAIRRAARGLDGEASSGEFEVAEAGGRIRLATASGGITLGAIAPLDALEASTTSGDLTLRLPRDARARLDARTSSGSIDCSIPITLEQSGRRQLAGRIGSGGPPIRLTTASGDIVVMNKGR